MRCGARGRLRQRSPARFPTTPTRTPIESTSASRRRTTCPSPSTRTHLKRPCGPSRRSAPRDRRECRSPKGARAARALFEPRPAARPPPGVRPLHHGPCRSRTSATARPIALLAREERIGPTIEERDLAHPQRTPPVGRCGFPVLLSPARAEIEGYYLPTSSHPHRLHVVTTPAPRAAAPAHEGLTVVRARSRRSLAKTVGMSSQVGGGVARRRPARR